MKLDIIIVGGLGHVGLPLGLAFAEKGLKVCLYDIDIRKANDVSNGIMPFIEYGAEKTLKNVLENGNLKISQDMNNISKAGTVIIATGTPVDEYLNPRTRNFIEIFVTIKKYLHKDQLIIIRSTIYPNTCIQILNILGKDIKLAYCPERIVEGYALKELNELPQIVSGISERSIKESAELFSILSPKIIKTSIGEAELVKLFSNAWRYIQFAVTNQFYMISNNFGVDYNKVRQAMIEGYGRAATLPTAGFSAGPCLLKDTMQLSAFNTNNFILGHAAMIINEGLPNYIVEDLKKRHDITKESVGILGMSYKKDIDDIRDSLSYKLGKILSFNGSTVYYSDEFVKDPTFVTKEHLIKSSDIIIVGVPHSAYKGMTIPEEKEVIDLWGIFAHP
jgi:UDP-N-acetyl-D-mannosaminuronic acid dehydrogenase